MKLPRIPLKEIKAQISELQEALWEDGDSEFSQLRICDAHELLFMLENLRTGDAFCLDLYINSDKNVTLEYIDDKIIKYLDAWIEKVTQEIVAEYKKKQEGGGAQ